MNLDKLDPSLVVLRRAEISRVGRRTQAKGTAHRAVPSISSDQSGELALAFFELHLESIAVIAHRQGMTLTLPESIEARFSPQSTALHLAIGLFVTEEATLGQAAEVAGLSQAAFLRELGKRHIPIHYGAEELAEDLRTVESLTR